MDTSIGGTSAQPITHLPLPVADNAEVWMRRSLFLSLALSVFITGAWSAYDILGANGFELIEAAILVLFLVSFAFVSVTFAQSLIGFMVFAFCKDPIAAASPIARAAESDIPLDLRIALVMPVYNEDPERVAARVEVILESLIKIISPAELQLFAMFVLSDTQDPKRGHKEFKIFSKLRAKLGQQMALTYRRRTPNTERKAGNIMDFCDHWGAEFDAMLVLDADSIMSGRAIVRLVRMMQSNPKAAIVQTVPRIVFAETAFARCMQFGHRLCGEILTAGSSFWQLHSGNYYGHNALIRIAPFAKHCRLPILKGYGSLSGEILSHDFVEASYLCRAGYEVWNVPDGEGSYEELPSNIIDYTKRDRRWCQGNLQHSRILIEPGIPPISRFHLFSGIMAYMSSLLWFVVIVLALTKFSYEALVAPVYFEQQYQLFPIWPEFKTEQAISLFCATLSLLLAPKFFGLLLALKDRRLRRGFGGVLRLFVGLLFECLYSTLIAPVMMVFNSQFIVSILSGKTIYWGAQHRDVRGLGFFEAGRCMLWQIFSGLVMLAVIVLIIPDQLWWICPILFGLLLAVPLAVVTSRRSLGIWIRRSGLFRIPEEAEPNWELKTLAEAD